jgi:hypothetical protein
MHPSQAGIDMKVALHLKQSLLGFACISSHGSYQRVVTCSKLLICGTIAGYAELGSAAHGRALLWFD